MTEAKRKTWLVFENVPAETLEDKLNSLTDDGYQLFKLESRPVGGPTTGLSVIPREYDIVVFDPMLLGERTSKGFTDMIKQQAGLLQGLPETGTPTG